MSMTTPQQQADAAAAARKEGEELAKAEGKTPDPAKPGPVPEPMAGTKSTLQKPATPA